MVRLCSAAPVLALAVSAPAMAGPAAPPPSPQAPPSLSQSAPQAGQPVPGAAAPQHPKEKHPDAKQDDLKPPKKGDTVVEVNLSLALSNVSSGNVAELGFDHVLSDHFQVGMLVGKKWIDYDAQYANIGMHSNGLYLTLSRDIVPTVVVQLRGGVVQDFYTGPQGPIPVDFRSQPTPNGSGRAFGVSLAMSSDQFNHVAFGWERHYIGGRTNDVFSVSWGLIAGAVVALEAR